MHILRKYSFIPTLLLTAILLAACASAGTDEQTVEATMQPPATATSTQTQPPTATFTLTPTSTKTATPTLTLTPVYKNPIAGLTPGQYVVYANGYYRNLYALSLDGSTKVQITDFDTYTSSISPNNDKIAYLSPNEDALKVLDLLTGEIESIKPGYLQMPYNPSWSPDGTKLVYNGVH
jgi:ABC-type Fe3+-hydroxamate transport system substrate-binding protein